MQRRVSRLALVAVVVVGLSGCGWAQFGFGPSHTFYTSDGTLNFENAPTATMLYNTGFGGQGSPVVVNGVVYVGNIAGLAAYDAAGRKNCVRADLYCDALWTGDTGGFEVPTAPAVVDGVVYAGAVDGNLYAFDAGGVTNCSAGVCEPMWKAVFGAVSFPASSPAVAGGVVYIGSANGNLYAFDAAGATNCAGTPKVCLPLWTATTGAAVRSTPAIANGTVYIGSGDGKLYAFDAPGSTNCSGTPTVCQPLWTAQPAQLIQSSPSIAYGKVYVAASGLFAYDAAGVTNCSGTPKVCLPLWTGETNGDMMASPAIAANRLFVGDMSGRLYEFDALGGVDHCTGTPVVCQPLGSLHTTAGIESSVALVGPKLLYVLDAAGHLDAFDRSQIESDQPGSPCGQCGPVWTHGVGSAGGFLYSSPAVAAGGVYANGTSVGIWAFKPPPPTPSGARNRPR